jgi:hypothetical protein
MDDYGVDRRLARSRMMLKHREDVTFWTQTLSCTEDQLRDAVCRVKSTAVEKVRAALATPTSSPLASDLRPLARFIDLGDEAELLYWTARLSCTSDELIAAVAAVGTTAIAVEVYIRGAKTGAAILPRRGRRSFLGRGFVKPLG